VNDWLPLRLYGVSEQLLASGSGTVEGDVQVVSRGGYVAETPALGLALVLRLVLAGEVHPGDLLDDLYEEDSNSAQG
jgi:hypothetical protein